MNKVKSTKGIYCQHKPSVSSRATNSGISYQDNPFVRIKNATTGITLVALVVTVVVLLILAGITIMYVMGDNSIFKLAKDAGEKTAEAVAREKVELMLKDYTPEKYIGTKTLEEYLNEQKGKGNLDEVTNNKNGTITVEVEEYEITIKEDNLSIVSVEKAGGTRPTFEIKTTKTDGSKIEPSEETTLEQKAITINITNIAEFGASYTIEVKDEVEKSISKEGNIINGVTGQASYIIKKSGTYTITVTGTKDGITKNTTKAENITVAKAQIEETEVSSTLKAIGVIDIVWLDTQNNVISEPISPANYLCKSGETGGLTAVKYDEAKKDWVPADTTNNENDWYNYEAQTRNWANARSSDKNAYFVWIPRYAYKITYFDTETNANAYRADSKSTSGIIGYSNREGIIAIKDGTEKLVTGSEPSNVTGKVKTKKYAEYIPHPAFEFGGAKAGIWVGKFEASSETPSATNGGGDNPNLKVRIVPNVASWRKIKVSNIFTVCQNVKTTYGLAGDSHMMKNTEWGAGAYLAESKYGRNGTEIAMNATSYTTGEGNYASKVDQSTTGNIYGIYDMNGGSWEYVAGYINNSNVSSNGYNTNLINAVKTNPKYADVYTVGLLDNQANNYSNSKGIKGDAVFETSTSRSNSTSWHSDYSSFPSTSSPVFGRGRWLQ